MTQHRLAQSSPDPPNPNPKEEEEQGRVCEALAPVHWAPTGVGAWLTHGHVATWLQAHYMKNDSVFTKLLSVLHL